MSNRCWHGGFANGGQEGGQAVGADAGEPCLVRRGGDGDDAESADDGCWRWVGVGVGGLTELWASRRARRMGVNAY
jgi:hypothetical protein